jgi:hypothetical protein
MKRFFTLSFMLLLSVVAFSQTLVSTNPENKKAILEEFTGTGCPNCPGGHTLAANLLTANPHQLFVIAYHPSNSSFTANDPMASTYASAFYTTPFISPTSRYMPSAMINRRVWGGVERIQGTSLWTGDVATIRTEASPLNVGLTSEYNEASKLLTVNAEVYFTSDVTDNLTVYCMLTESGIIATQSGGTSPYTHNHVFREAMVAQWGDPVTAPTTVGTTKSFTFTFDNSVKNYVMAECEVVVFIRNASTEEVISGNGAPVNQASPISVNENNLSLTDVSISPNPASGFSHINITLAEAADVHIMVSNLAGQLVAEQHMGTIGQGTHTLPVDHTVFQNTGLYLVYVKVGDAVTVRKLAVR